VNVVKEYSELYAMAKEVDSGSDLSIKSQWIFKDYSPLLFDALREIDGVTTNLYLQALNPESFLGNLKQQAFSEGKSGSFFCFSPGRDFIMKTIPNTEAEVLSKILPNFYQYLSRNPKSILMRIYGLYSLKIEKQHHSLCDSSSKYFQYSKTYS